MIIFCVTNFMQGTYIYVPETNYVSRVYCVAAVLYLQSVLHVMLFRPVKHVLYVYTSTVLLLRVGIAQSV
jgi:hypothetical protein